MKDTLINFIKYKNSYKEQISKYCCWFFTYNFEYHICNWHRELNYFSCKHKVWHSIAKQLKIKDFGFVTITKYRECRILLFSKHVNILHHCNASPVVATFTFVFSKWKGLFCDTSINSGTNFLYNGFHFMKIGLRFPKRWNTLLILLIRDSFVSKNCF